MYNVPIAHLALSEILKCHVTTFKKYNCTDPYIIQCPCTLTIGKHTYWLHSKSHIDMQSLNCCLLVLLLPVFHVYQHCKSDGWNLIMYSFSYMYIDNWMSLETEVLL